MESRRGPIVDGMSRFLSTLGLLAGLGGLGGCYYLYQENQTLKNDLSTQIKEAGISVDAVKEFNQKWENNLNTALTDFETRANKNLEIDDSAREARKRIFDTVVGQLRVDRLNVEEIVDRRIQEIAPAPRLLVAENRMKTDGERIYRVPVRNIGTATALIETATFRPLVNGEFRLREKLTMEEADENAVVVEFSPHDNKAKTVGRHDDYVRDYLEPEDVIGPGQTVMVSVEIQNSEHMNWGWQGELELKYADGESLVIPNINARFVPTASDSYLQKSS